MTLIAPGRAAFESRGTRHAKLGESRFQVCRTKRLHPPGFHITHLIEDCNMQLAILNRCDERFFLINGRTAL
ncbi:hypothetical protein Q9Q95_07495 [Sphingomonas sp. DG1-23]|uniref:hypothetical protein n=1 Tax=Sphingomonas sp. DG1-23 TaxID=3068316 RepID=UPI00273FDC12|nr:hypothetical protein [Sphingomonas sp. DG1-23]MDP5278762.1 hypothetical protein [Sphingomonas sp. DG1-23]